MDICVSLCVCAYLVLVLCEYLGLNTALVRTGRPGLDLEDHHWFKDSEFF